MRNGIFMQRNPAFDVVRDIPFVLGGYCSGGNGEDLYISLPINVSLNKDVNCILLLECDSLFSTADRFKTNTLYMYV